MEPNQTYKFYTAKETIKNNNKKRQPTYWEKIFANNVTNKDLISKIQKQLIHLNNNAKSKQKQQKNNEKKMDRRPKQTSLRRKNTEG